MNEPGNDPISSPMENQETVEGLRRELNLVFAGFVIMSFTLTAFLGLQAHRASMDLLAVKHPAEETIRVTEQDDAAVAATFGKLTEFGRAHPDFQKQVLSKFHLNTSTNAPAEPAKK